MERTNLSCEGCDAVSVDDDRIPDTLLQHLFVEGPEGLNPKITLCREKDEDAFLWIPDLRCEHVEGWDVLPCLGLCWGWDVLSEPFLEGLEGEISFLWTDGIPTVRQHLGQSATDPEEAMDFFLMGVQGHDRCVCGCACGDVVVFGEK